MTTAKKAKVTRLESILWKQKEELTKQRDSLKIALENCLELMHLTHPHGTPIQIGTFRDELAWDRAVMDGRNALKRLKP